MSRSTAKRRPPVLRPAAPITTMAVMPELGPIVTAASPPRAMTLAEQQAEFDAALANLQDAHGRAVQALFALRQARIASEDAALDGIQRTLVDMNRINRSPMFSFG